MIDTNKQWNGYTLEELRFRRMLSLAKFELGKTSLASEMHSLTSGRVVRDSLFSKIFGALNYADYAILAFRLCRNMLHIFRRRR